MATFVLVHGAWHGGWCWRKVVPLLEAAGHAVYAPTLTGLAERAAELSPDVGLDTHIQDIAGLLVDNNLHEVILVGHSYGDGHHRRGGPGAGAHWAPGLSGYLCAA